MDFSKLTPAQIQALDKFPTLKEEYDLWYSRKREKEWFTIRFVFGVGGNFTEHMVYASVRTLDTLIRHLRKIYEQHILQTVVYNSLGMKIK